MCAICGGTLNRTLMWPHPQATVADHIEPWVDAPHLRYAAANGQAAHKLCNEQKGRHSRSTVPQSTVW